MDSSFPLAGRIAFGGRFEWRDENGEWVQWRPDTSHLSLPRKPMNESRQAAFASAMSRVGADKKPALQDYTVLVDHLLEPRTNIRAQQIEFRGVSITEEQFEHVHGLMLQQHDLRFRKADLQTAIRYVASLREYDPVKEELDSFACEACEVLSNKEWQQIAALCFGVDGEYEGKVLRRFLISAAARVYQPGCKVDQALILYGRQGLGKSTFFRLLGGDYFSDSLGDLTREKDDLQKLHRCWIAEWGEVDQVFAGAQKAEQVKRFVSAQRDDFRPPYGRNVRPHERRSVIVGSTNRDDWATDHTGNRRYPVIEPKGIDGEWIAANRARILGRAVAEFRSGTTWWFDAEEEAEITRRTAEYAPEDPSKTEILAYLMRQGGLAVNARELWVEALKQAPEQFDQRAASRIGRAAHALASHGVLNDRKWHVPRKASGGQPCACRIFWLPSNPTSTSSGC
jgi:predicted P-loop ATPase